MGKIDATRAPRVLALILLHELGGAPHDARNPGLADEHVVRFFGEHEARGARERIEPTFGERQELELAVAIGEEREHEERQPIGARLVEGAEDARAIGVSAAPLEQGVGFLAPVASEVRREQVRHRPEVAAFLDVDLKEIAQIVHAGARLAERALLLDAGRLGVALGDDEAAERVSVLAGHFGPHRLAQVIAKADGAARDRIGQEDAPAVVGHLHVVEVRPPVVIDRNGRAQEHVVAPESRAGPISRHHDKNFGCHCSERALQLLVAGEVDVVGDLVVVDDVRHCPTSSRSRTPAAPVYRSA